MSQPILRFFCMSILQLEAVLASCWHGAARVLRPVFAAALAILREHWSSGFHRMREKGV